MSETFFPEGKEIEIAGEKFIIKPFVLRVRTQVLKILVDIIMTVRKANPGIDPKKLLEDISMTSNMLSVLVESAGEKLVDIYQITTGKDKDWLMDHMQLKDEFILLKTISEVNDLPFLFGQVKSALKGFENQGEALAEVLAFLAKECGWDHNYIADHFTLQQINKYYETIQLQKLRETQLQGIVTMYAVGRAFGSIKVGDFKAFLDKLDPRIKKDVHKAIDEMKIKKLNIEDK